MTTETDNATQSGAKDESTTETTREPTARELAMEAIADQNNQRLEDEANKGDPGKNEQELPASQDQQIAAQLESKPDDISKMRVKVKIDGVESEVTIEEMQRQYQKNGAAERRLEEATRLLHEARANQTNTDPLRFAQTEQTTDSQNAPKGDDGQGKEFLSALFEGDEAKALDALQKIGFGRPSPTLDTSQLAAQLTPAIKQQLVVESALDKFKVDYADIVADPYLADLADRYLDAEVNDGKPFTEALEQAGQKTRDWLKSKGVVEPKPSPTIDRNTKLERKAGMDRLPALNSKATTIEAPEQTATDVINEMRKSRGLEVI